MGYEVLGVVAVLVFVGAAFYAYRKSKATPARQPASTAQPTQPSGLEVLKNVIKDEGEKTRVFNAVKHEEVKRGVDALHKRWDKDDEKEKGDKK